MSKTFFSIVLIFENAVIWIQMLLKHPFCAEETFSFKMNCNNFAQKTQQDFGKVPKVYLQT